MPRDFHCGDSLVTSPGELTFSKRGTLASYAHMGVSARRVDGLVIKASADRGQVDASINETKHKAVTKDVRTYSLAGQAGQTRTG